MPDLNFTKAALETLPTPEKGKKARYSDTKVRALTIKVNPTGKRAFYHYRKVEGRPVETKLGDFPEMTIDQARRAAEELNAEIAKGGNPLTARQSARAEWTFAELFTWYMDHHARDRKKTWREDEKNYQRYLQGLAGRQLSTITRTDVRQLHASIARGIATKENGRSGRYAANRTLALLRSIYAKAIAHEVYAGANPAAGIELFKEQSRARRLTAAEFPAFFAAVDAEPSEDIRDYVLLSLCTGARKSNVLAMRWADVHLASAEWRIPETKNGMPQIIPLEEQELAILARRKKAATGPWVFPGRGGSETGHMNNPARGWKRILDEAGIEDFRLHDLRRTLGSLMADSGASLHVIGKALGHKSQAATLIYARLSLDPVRQAKRAGLAALQQAME